MMKNINRNNIKVKAVVGSRGFLITDPNDITVEHIDAICAYVEDGDFLDTAIGLVGIDPESFHKVINNRKLYPLAKYAHDATKKAEWTKEHIMRKKIMDPQQFNAKLLYEFMTATNPKLQARTRQQIRYDNAIMLQTVRNVLGLEAYVKVLEALSDNDPYEVVAALDTFLLHE